MSGSQLPVQVALVLLTLAHLAWTGVIAGSFTASVAIDALGGARVRRFAPTVARLGRLGLLTSAALVASATLLLVLARVRYPAFVHAGSYWAGVLLPLVAGLALLGLFQSRLEAERLPSLRPSIGLAGIGLVVGSCLLLVGGAGVLLQPEAWATSEPAHRFLPTWSGTGRFLEFTLLSFAATGALISWAAAGVEDPAVARFARRFGGGVTLLCALAWPLAILFTLFNLPDIALSAPLWGLAGAGVVLAGGTAGLAASRMGGDGSSRVRPLALEVAGLLAILVVSDHVARERVLQPATLAGVVAAPAAAPLPAPPPPEAEGRLAAGKAVFDRVCHACHRFDVKRVGPPLDRVVPKYRKDPEALRAFLRSPVKVDPAYPAMPKPAVTEEEIAAVAAYLLEEAAP